LQKQKNILMKTDKLPATYTTNAGKRTGKV
jgi:hypothetical protein